MKILLIDNVLSRHDLHQKTLTANNNSISLDIKESLSVEELKNSNYDIYAIHQGNSIEYRFVFQNQCGEHRFFFSGAARNNKKQKDLGYFSDVNYMYLKINEILKND